MPPNTYRPDRDRILSLIRDQGETVTDFAHRLGRHRQSFWQLDRKPIGRAFAVQVATALGVEVSDITLPDEDETPGDEEDAAAKPAA